MRFIGKANLSRLAGLAGMLGTAAFVVAVVILNIITPHYSVLGNTISALAVNQYGDIYTFFLVILALSVFALGLGLNCSLFGQTWTSKGWFLPTFALGLLFIAYFKMDLRLDDNYRNFVIISRSGQIHFLSTLLSLVLFPIGVLALTRQMATHKYWRPLTRYTHFTLYTGVVMGGIWFLLFAWGLGIEYKGIFQKIILFDLIGWCFVVSYWLYKKQS